MRRNSLPAILSAGLLVGLLPAATAVAEPAQPSAPPANQAVSRRASTDKELGRALRYQAQQPDLQQPSSPAEVSAALANSEAGAPPGSTWAGTAEIASANTTFTHADGDLWPSCWARDDAIYTAWGDGAGFDLDSGFVDVGTA